jgi:hypothetical protein
VIVTPLMVNAVDAVAFSLTCRELERIIVTHGLMDRDVTVTAAMILTVAGLCPCQCDSTAFECPNGKGLHRVST